MEGSLLKGVVYQMSFLREGKVGRGYIVGGGWVGEF